MTENIRVLTHSSIKLTGKEVVYVDPFHIREESHDGDIILITHDHFDHFSPEDIAKVAKTDTLLVVPERMKGQAEGMPCKKVITVIPGAKEQVDGIEVEAVPAYNREKQFHPKESGWVGYVITLDGTRIYVAGDTDMTPENRAVSCDVAMVPIGGTYTMAAEEAAELVNAIQPKVAIPTHYGSVAGGKEDEAIFQQKVASGIPVKIKMEVYG